MITKLLTAVRTLARLSSQLSGNAVDTPTPTQGVVHIPGSALDVTIGAVNDGPSGQTDTHVSGDGISYTDGLSYGIRFLNLDLWTLFLIGLNHKRAIGRID